MKKLILFASILAFSSCNDIEDTVNDVIPTITVEQSINESLDIQLDQLGSYTQTFTVAVDEINEALENYSDGSIDIKDVSIDDLEVMIDEKSEETNFDFLDSLSIVISSDANTESITIDFGTIEQGTNTLSLPEGSSESILSLIDGDDVNELTFDLNIVTNKVLEETLYLELTATLIAELELML